METMKVKLKSKVYRYDGTQFQDEVFFLTVKSDGENAGQMYAKGTTLLDAERLYDNLGNRIELPEYAGWTGRVCEDVLSDLIDSYNIYEDHIFIPFFINDKNEAYNSYYILPDGRLMDNSYHRYGNAYCLYGDSKYDEVHNLAYTISHPKYKELKFPTFNDLLHKGWTLMQKDLNGNYFSMTFKNGKYVGN